MNIAIAGYGVEGEQNYQYCQQLGHEVTIVDENPKPTKPLPDGAQTILGDGALARVVEFDMVVRTAGLAPYKLPKGPLVWSATNEFFRQCPAPIIGVTGSKGKGTTCSLIAEILRAAGNTVHLVGNIGVSALERLPEISPRDLVVYELSSFQLWDAERSPHVAVVLHIEADHLDVHTDFAEYIAAKANIVKFQTRNDSCFYHPTNHWSEVIAEQQPDFAHHAVKYATSDSGESDLVSVYVKDDYFVTTTGETICATSELKLPGAHNLDNACAAIAAARSYTSDNAAIAKGLNSFTGLPHRLKYVATKQSVDYFDDSIATTPGSAIAAARAFDKPKVMILGGSSKGAEFDELAQTLKAENVRHALLIGDEAASIAAALESAGMNNFSLSRADTMAAFVAEATQYAKPGDVVVLSPACASFGLFKNYADRGDQFIAAVQKL